MSCSHVACPHNVRMAFPSQNGQLRRRLICNMQTHSGSSLVDRVDFSLLLDKRPVRGVAVLLGV